MWHATGAQAALAQLDDAVGGAAGQRLCIGVGNNEIDAFNLCSNHIGDSVTASATNTNNSDFRLQLVNHWWTDIDAHNFIPLAIPACSKFSRL